MFTLKSAIRRALLDVHSFRSTSKQSHYSSLHHHIPPQRDCLGESCDHGLTWAEDAFVTGTGEIVAFAEAAVDLPELRLVAQTLVAAAFPSSTADLLALWFPAGVQVYAAALSLLALTAGAQVARLTVAGATIIGAWRRSQRLYSTAVTVKYSFLYYKTIVKKILTF